MYDFYKIFGVERNATVSEIKLAYRRKAKLYHPDVNSSASAHDYFTILNNANDTLCDEKKRRTYDFKLEYGEFIAANNSPEQQPHRDPAYRRKPAKETNFEEPEETDSGTSRLLFRFLLFSILFIGMLCFFIPALAVYYDVINFGVLILFLPGIFMIRDVTKEIFFSE